MNINNEGNRDWDYDMNMDRYVLSDWHASPLKLLQQGQNDGMITSWNYLVIKMKM